MCLEGKSLTPWRLIPARVARGLSACLGELQIGVCLSHGLRRQGAASAIARHLGGGKSKFMQTFGP